MIGTNGSGKSTLLNAVAGSFLIDSGSISLAGTDITRRPEHRRANLIGRVFQNPASAATAVAPALCQVGDSPDDTQIVGLPERFLLACYLRIHGFY